jgi:hypothetical protein
LSWDCFWENAAAGSARHEGDPRDALIATARREARKVTWLAILGTSHPP